MNYSINDGTILVELEKKVDTINARRVEEELDHLVKENHGLKLQLDAEKLEYISSAGLRVLLKIWKTQGCLRMINVSRGVYEILEVTGFLDLLDIKRKIREISLDGCELISKGVNGEVYRLDGDTILKLFHEDKDLETISQENRYVTAAFTNGVPCAISYDTVKAKGRYGIVFELINAVTVGKAVDDDPGLIPELGKKMGALMKLLHTTDMSDELLPQMSEKVNQWIDSLEDKYLSHEDAELMRSLAGAIPETDTLVHGDFHEGNVMVQDDELILIDMDDISIGNPLFDLADHYLSHVVSAKANYDSVLQAMGIKAETAIAMRKYTMMEYLGTDEEKVLEAYDEKMQLISLFFTVLFLAREKGTMTFTPEGIQDLLGNTLPRLREKAAQIREVFSQADSLYGLPQM